MQPLFRSRAPVVAGACILVAVGLASVVLEGDQKERAGGLAYGQIYTTEEGDPIDLLFEAGDPGSGCMTSLSGGIFYGGSNVSCFDLEVVDEGGTYRLVLPRHAEDPAVLVGVMPAGATGATASGVGREPARAETRGRWFLASLEPSDPSVLDLETLDVDFDY